MCFCKPMQERTARPGFKKLTDPARILRQSDLCEVGGSPADFHRRGFCKLREGSASVGLRVPQSTRKWLDRRKTSGSDQLPLHSRLTGVSLQH